LSLLEQIKYPHIVSRRGEFQDGWKIALQVTPYGGKPQMDL